MTETDKPKAVATNSALDRGELCHRSFSLLRKRPTTWRIDADGLWSYPAIALSRSGEPLWLLLISNAVALPKHKKTAIFRPKAVVLTQAQLPYVVRYENWRHGHDPFPNEKWDTPVAMFPHKSIAMLTHSDFIRRERELLGMYPVAQEEFLKNRSLPKAFSRSFLELTPPIFIKYLNPLASEFVQALEVQGFK